MPQAPSVGDFPVILFELDVVLAQVDTDGLEAAEVLIDNIVRRRLQDDLELLVLIQAVRIFAVTAIRGPAAWLHICDAIRLGAEHAKERLRAHRPRADFQS